MNPVTLYILKCNDGSFYTGITNDIDGRLIEHVKGIKGKYFSRKALHPFILIYKKEFTDRKEASRKEKYFKRLSRVRLLKELKVTG